MNGVHPLAGPLSFSAKLISGARARWYNSAPDARQRIYFANHSSHLDLLVLWASLPPDIRVKTRPVAAKDYWDRGWLRRYVAGEIFHALLIERSDGHVASHSVLQPFLDALDRGYSLILFPEGTRGSGEDIAPFKSGLYYLCCERHDLEAAPVYLENLNRILPKGEFLPAPLLSRVTFGPSLRWKPEESKEQFLHRARTALSELRNV